jgi:NAD dependent epimerase/dehydratase
MTKILITGADGFIGSHLTEMAVKAGYDVVAMALYNSFGTHGWLDTIDPATRAAVDVRLGDIRDRGSVASAMQGCDAVLNLAALIAIPYSYQAPESYIDTNIKGTANILETARLHGTSKIVHISTSEVYGTAQYVPIDELHPLNAQSPYAATKIAADQLALSYNKSFGLSVAVARPFNTYGPRQSSRAVIPTIITQIAKGANEIKLGALTPTRDFNFVEDTASGILAILKSDKSSGEVINLGSNFEISIGDTAKTIARLMSRDITIIEESQRLRPEKSEVERLWAENKKAKALLGWAPEFGGQDGLQKGLTKTIDWFSRAENLSRYHGARYDV